MSHKNKMESLSDIKKKFHKNGYVILKGFLSKNKEFKDFQRYISLFLQNNTNLKKRAVEDYNELLIREFVKNHKISSFINDNINNSPQLKKCLILKK